MNYLLDTCVLAEFMKPQPSAAVVHWMRAQRSESLFISVLAVGEIRKGIAKLPASKRRKALEQFLENLLSRFDRKLLLLDVDVLFAWGDLTGRSEARGRTLSVIDSMLAATAIVKDLTVVTRNVTDFTNTGVKILNIWDDHG